MSALQEQAYPASRADRELGDARRDVSDWRMPAANMPTIMMYSHDGFGVGHLRRTVNIATQLVRELPSVNVLVLCGSPSIGLFDLPVGVDMVKLPSIVKVKTNEWQPGSLKLSAENVRGLREQLIMRTVELFRPAVLLVDHMPKGVWGDLLPTFENLQRLDAPPTVLLGLRDILDAPKVTRAHWKRDGVYEAIDKYYDEVLVYGCAEVFDTAHEYGLRELTSTPVRYCGYVCTQEKATGREHVLDAISMRADKLVLVTAGGGRDAFPMMRASLDALRDLRTDEQISGVVITGPLMQRDERDALKRMAADLTVRVLASVSDSISYIDAADVVVTMGGYNTVMEAVSLQKQTIVIPRSGPSAEQKMRADMLARFGAVRVVEQEQAGADRLAREIDAALSSDTCARPQVVNGDGTRAVARRIRELLIARGDVCPTLEQAAAPAQGASL